MHSHNELTTLYCDTQRKSNPKDRCCAGLLAGRSETSERRCAGTVSAGRAQGNRRAGRSFGGVVRFLGRLEYGFNVVAALRPIREIAPRKIDAAVVK